MSAYLVDAMLGKLAKWMRILGLDTAFPRPTSDEALIEIARDQGRTLVTRDRLLARRKAIQDKCILIGSEDWREQISELVIKSGCREEIRPMSRCISCNGLLEPAEGASLGDRLPAFVLASTRSFSRCPSCGRIYWPGTHFKKIEKTLRDLGFNIHKTDGAENKGS